MKALSRNGFVALWVCIFSASLARAALVNPDFQIGPNVPVDSLSVAASGSNYLVVWRDLSGAPNALTLSGAIVSSTGVVGSAFSISNAGGTPQRGPVQRARVAFDGTNYLVVWHDLRSNGTGVRGAFVSPQGAIVGGSDFLIANVANMSGVNPQIVFSGSTYCVAWQDAPMSSSGQQIYFTHVTKSGVASLPASVPPLAGHNSSQQFEMLVPGGVVSGNGETLLVYQDIGATPITTYAVRVEADNSISGPVSGTLMSKQDFSALGGGAPIGGAYLTDTQEYLLLLSKGAQIDCVVSRAWLEPSGRTALSTAPLALVGQGATSFDENNFPRAFFNGAHEFFFPRNSQVSSISSHIFMKRVNIAGTLSVPPKNNVTTDLIDQDPNMVAVDTSSSGLLNGAAVAAIPAATGSQYLVVWMDGRRRVTDPPMQTNVYGALVDGTQAGSTVRPYIRPGPAVAPQVGNAPLTVAVGPGTSTGIVDGGNWNFGDGTISTAAALTHKYVNAGSYLAIFTLAHTGLNFNTYFQIDVASTSVIGGAGGPPQSVGGVVGPTSAGINTQVALESLTATLNLAKTNVDTLHLTGAFDVSRIPNYLTGQQCVLSIGSETYTATLLADGTFVSTAGATPVIVFQLIPSTGFFSLTVSSDNLLASLAGTGVTNATASKQTVTIPVSASLAGLSTTQSVQAQYTATAGVTGKITYQLGTTGTPGEGLLVISGGQATQRFSNGKTGTAIHDFVVIGNLTPPGGIPLVAASGGKWHIAFGNHAEDIPTGSLTLANNIYTYKPTKFKSGIQQFAYYQKTGAFIMALKSIAAQGEDASGMALAFDQVTRADMAVSFDLDVTIGKIQAGDFLRLVRKDVSKMKWSLR